MAERTDGAEKAAREGQEKAPEVTIKFGKGLVEEPFTSKNGKELVAVKIPNRDPDDHRPWESFVVSPKMVHDNQFGKGVWMKLPADGTTKVNRPVLEGQDENGKNIWGTESRTVSNKELKSMMESYKEKSRGSVLDDLAGKRTEAADAAKTAPKRDFKPRQEAR